MTDKIEVTAWAPTREAALAFMVETGVAEEVDGRIVPLVQAHITSTDDGWMVGRWIGGGENAVFDARPGWFANVEYYGDTAQALLTGGDPDAVDLFDRAPGLLYITEARIGEPMTWVALSSDPVPPGYQNSSGVRLFDPALIASPNLVKQ